MLPAEGEHELLAGRPVRRLVITNLADRPVQVGSHYELSQANPALELDREAARGHRLAVPAGTSVRFEPGASREVEAVALAGNAVVPGLRLLGGGAA
nr:urease subunit beta [Rothia halotolerans]